MAKEISHEAQILFENLISEPRLPRKALDHARHMAEPGEAIVLADLVAAEKYLQRCIANMSRRERALLDEDRAACLWGRGCLGAARYRVSKAKKAR